MEMKSNTLPFRYKILAIYYILKGNSFMVFGKMDKVKLTTSANSVVGLRHGDKLHLLQHNVRVILKGCSDNSCYDDFIERDYNND